MVYEYALDPEMIASWAKPENFRFFIDKFGWGTPRALSEYPGFNNWKSRVKKAIEGTNNTDKAKLADILKILQENRIKRDGKFNGDLSWLENAFAEHQDRPFQAIIVTSNPDEFEAVLHDNKLRINPDTRWDLPNEVIVKKTAEEMTRVVEPMLRLCNEVIFIDPIFGADMNVNRFHRSRYFKSFEAYFQSILKNRYGKNPDRIEIQTSGNVKFEHFRNAIEGNLPGIVPNGIKVKVIRWRKRERGPELHDRYIITDIGGVEFSKGLDISKKEGVTEKITLLGKKSYTEYWHRYCGSSPDFDCVDEPLEIIGKKPR
jgi:hypothetical protein